MLNKLKHFIFILLLAVITLPAAADVLNDYFNTTHSFKAEFDQIQYDVDQQVIDKSSGFIRVKRPDKFNLEYTKPFHLLYLADGKKLWSYDEDLEQVIVKPQQDVLANSPAMILSNPKILKDHYQIIKQEKEQGLEWYKLHPNNQDAGFESVSLGFFKDSIKVMELQDSFGQTTRLEFKYLQKNVSFETNIFQFKAPKGVDVISQ